MKKYFDRLFEKIGNTKQRMNNYWNRQMNDSTHKKMPEGAQQISKLITSPAKDQWRRKEEKK